MLRATNEISSTASLVGYALFAAVPSAPAAGPSSDASITNKARIAATWSAIPTADNGGSEILGYQLEIDDGAGGNFSALTGEGVAGVEDYLKLSYTVYSGIAEGTYYRFRYRGKNAAGWGPYSPITHLQAAAVPEKPPAPTLGAATDLGVTLNLLPSTEDGGSPITAHKIFRDDGTGLGPISYPYNHALYDGSASGYTATIATDALVLGTTYRFVYVATNAFGDSAYSLHLIAGVGAPLQLAVAPTRDSAYNQYFAGNNTV